MPSKKTSTVASVQCVVRRPTGFVAKCQCGVFTGAIDAARTDRSEMAKMLGQWLFDGKTVEPRFGGTWSEQLNSCQCKKKERETREYVERTKDIDILGW